MIAWIKSIIIFILITITVVSILLDDEKQHYTELSLLGKLCRIWVYITWVCVVLGLSFAITWLIHECFVG